MLDKTLFYYYHYHYYVRNRTAEKVKIKDQEYTQLLCVYSVVLTIQKKNLNYILYERS